MEEHPNLKNNKWIDTFFFSAGNRLGDAFVYNAIVHYFAEKSNTLYLPAEAAYYESIACLYQDYCNIKVVLPNEFQYLKETTKNAVHFPGFSIELTQVPLNGDYSDPVVIPINWERQIYEDMDFLYSMRFKGFRFPKHVEGSEELYEKLTGGEKDYVVVNKYMNVKGVPEHININISSWSGDYKIVEITPTYTCNMLQYITLLQRAKQVHIVPSAMFCMLDSIIDTIQGELFIHLIRKEFLSQINCKWNSFKWQTVKYQIQF
jgi:hypothetical protein